jgi:hypothetical protein
MSIRGSLAARSDPAREDAVVAVLGELAGPGPGRKQGAQKLKESFHEPGVLFSGLENTASQTVTSLWDVRLTRCLA